ncbi:hypothetical protein HYR99_32365 [Candidatus Poribacteria bacterium]|nr:hypothetical protein [Candidatus Poribacteria bacterium]
MTALNLPIKTEPDTRWPHYRVWERVRTLFYSLPNYFETELVIKGINVTEIFSVGSAFSSVVETQVVAILNRLRNLWDPENECSKCAFIRQSQTFPDVLLQNLQNQDEILFGIELKSWYILSKEGEPSFRYQITPEACADADLLVVIPWMLSDVISGTPQLLPPYTESARYAAEYRNYYWQKSRIEQGKNFTIRKPPESNRHAYPSSKQEASDEAEDDKGGNFGRIARAGILDEYIASIKQQDYLGIKIRHWIAFFKAISETRTDAEIEGKLLALKNQIQNKSASSQPQQTFLELLSRLEELWEEFS